MREYPKERTFYAPEQVAEAARLFRLRYASVILRRVKILPMDAIPGKLPEIQAEAYAAAMAQAGTVMEPEIRRPLPGDLEPEAAAQEIMPRSALIGVLPAVAQEIMSTTKTRREFQVNLAGFLYGPQSWSDHGLG